VREPGVHSGHRARLRKRCRELREPHSLRHARMREALRDPCAARALGCTAPGQHAGQTARAEPFDELAPSVFRYPELIRRPVKPVVLSLISTWLLKQSTRNPAVSEPS
jgi:hypothetical protein